MTVLDTLTEAERSSLGGAPATGLTDAIPDRLAKQTPHYDVEYGIRADDAAMVFHFYPPGTDWAEYPSHKIGSWEAEYRMHDRLEESIPKVFDVERVKATFTEETQSFCIIAYGIGNSLDPWYFVRRFFDAIDAPR